MDTLVTISNQQDLKVQTKNTLTKDFKDRFINVELSATIKKGKVSSKKVIIGKDDLLTVEGYFISMGDLSLILDLLNRGSKNNAGLGVQFGYGSTNGSDNKAGLSTSELQLVISVVENFGSKDEKITATFTTAKIDSGGGTTIPSGGTKYPS